MNQFKEKDQYDISKEDILDIIRLEKLISNERSESQNLSILESINYYINQIKERNNINLKNDELRYIISYHHDNYLNRYDSINFLSNDISAFIIDELSNLLIDHNIYQIIDYIDNQNKD